MVVENDTRRQFFNGTGSLNHFDFTIKYFNANEISVYVGGVLVSSSLYTVTANAAGDGGTVTFITPPVAGTRNVLITANLDYTQEMPIPTVDKLGRGVLETVADKNTILSQQLKDAVERSIRFGVTVDNEDVDTDLPAPDPGKAIIWNATADGLTNSSSNPDDLVTAAAQSATDAALSAAGAATSESNAASSATTAVNNANAAAVSAASAAASASSVNLPTIASGDERKNLQIRSDLLGYEAVGPLMGRRNFLIGSDFGLNPWQRGTSFTAIANTAYCADRWQYIKSGAMVHTVSRSTDTPTVAQAGRLMTNSLLANLTTADTSIAAGDYCAIRQNIEGYMFKNFAQRPVVLSFWVKATTTGTYCAALTNGIDKSYVAEYTINVTDTWELKTVTFTASPSAGTWDYTNALGISLVLTLAAGSTYQTTAGTWQSGNYIATSNQVNGVNTGATNFRIAGVQLELGAKATPFDVRPQGEVLRDCQRYYSKSFNIATAPAQNAGRIGSVAGVASTTLFIRDVRFPVSMRTTPTITTYNPSAANANWRAQTPAADRTAAIDLQGEHSCLLYTTGATANDDLYIHYTADAEI